jgi:hypothetical protein
MAISAVGRVPLSRRSILPDAALIETSMSVLFVISAACVVAAIVTRPVYAMLRPVRSRG